MLKIKSIEKNGIGKEIGLKNGDEILSFDHFKAVDILDYLFYDARDNFVITVKQTNGDVSDCEIEKDEDESLGLTFESNNLNMKTCNNNCIFCFIDQMPKGMRETLYVKDDDYRQSFLCGNFVTLTNVTDSDIERICRLKLSPLYISVHTMNGELRKKLMNNRFADKITEQLKTLKDAGIIMNTQIVLARDYNDGKELEYTVRELYKLYPFVKTVAVVPVGMTKFRDGLTKIRNIDKEYSLELIENADKWNGEFKVNFVQLADEFYFTAEREVKDYEFYGDFSQIENGVGTTAKFEREIKDNLIKCNNKGRFMLVSGTKASEYMKKTAKVVKEYIEGIEINVLTVENDYFGHSVNCTGLLTGSDILKNALKHIEEFDCLVMPRNVLKEKSDLFLDGMTLAEFKLKLKKEVRITEGTGESFVNALKERINE